MLDQIKQEKETDAFVSVVQIISVL